MKNYRNSSLTFLSVIMIIFGICYAILGTLSIIGTITGVFPGHEEHNIIIILLAYITSILAVVGGIIGIKQKYSLTKKVAIIFAMVGLASIIYILLAQEAFNNFDVITIVLGLGIAFFAATSEKEIKELKKLEKKKKEEAKIKEKTKTTEKTPKKKTVKKSENQKKKTTTKTKKEK